MRKKLSRFAFKYTTNNIYYNTHLKFNMIETLLG